MPAGIARCTFLWCAVCAVADLVQPDVRHGGSSRAMPAGFARCTFLWCAVCAVADLVQPDVSHRGSSRAMPAGFARCPVHAGPVVRLHSACTPVRLHCVYYQAAAHGR